MNTSVYLAGSVAGAAVLFIVVYRLRKGVLRERHALWWVLLALTAILVGFVPAILNNLATALGIEVPANLAFFVSIAVLFLVSLQHASDVTKLENKTRVLVEHVAMLEERMAALESGSMLHETKRPGEDNGGA